MMTWFLIGLLWLVGSLIAGTAFMGMPTDDLGTEPRGFRRLAQFALGFLGWVPLMIILLLFVLYFWDLIIADEWLREHDPENDVT